MFDATPTTQKAKTVHVLSLGAGVQSSTLALMAERGEVIINGETWRPDFAIFSDTQAEPRSVYKWLDWLQTQLSYPIHKVTQGDLQQDNLRVRTSKRSGLKYLNNLVPLFTAKRGTSEKKGILSRKCTRDYKIFPINRFVREECRLKDFRVMKRVVAKTPGKKWEFEISYPGIQVVMWIGISTDEATRMKPSQQPWSVNAHPLIDMGMSRSDCLAWMKDRGYPQPPRSACYFCPYHSDVEWRRLRDEEPEEFARAVQWEKDMQTAATQSDRLKDDIYLHVSCVPLDKVAFKEHDPKNNFQNECEGMCGV